MSEFHLSLTTFGDGAETGTNGNGLTGDFEADFNKYFGGGATPVPRKEAETQTEGPNDADSASAEDEEDTSEQSEDADAQKNTETTENPDEEFEKLTGRGGKYASQMQAKTQKIINERFKASKLTEKELSDLYGAIAPIMDKYGYQRGGDIEDFAKAILADKGNLISRSLSEGIDVEDAAKLYNDQREAARQREAEEAEAQTTADAEAEAQREAEEAEKRAIYDRWKTEAAELQKTFKDFDLAAEITSSPTFKAALEAGLSVKQAYYAQHGEDVMANVAGAVAQETAAKTAQSLAARSVRPTEGASGAAPAAMTVRNVNDLSEKDIYKAIEMAGRYGKISLEDIFRKG